MENQHEFMKDILFKPSTLRKAIALATVTLSDKAVMATVNNKTVPKGDIFEFSRAAGLLAIKKTPDVIPDCHPLPIEHAAIKFCVDEMVINISVEVHTIYKTGVEVEAMHGAAIVALTIYDMLKPLDKKIEISSIRLEMKSGGKSEIKNEIKNDLRVVVVVCSDSISNSLAVDLSGKEIIAKLEKMGIHNAGYEIIPDDFKTIQEKAFHYSSKDYDLILFTGGTGVSARDNTPDAIEAIIDRNIPGIMEVARKYGQDRTPYAMLSRGVAGFVKNSLIITMPGSLSGVTDTMNALFPSVLHLFSVRSGATHR